MPVLGVVSVCHRAHQCDLEWKLLHCLYIVSVTYYWFRLLLFNSIMPKGCTRGGRGRATATRAASTTRGVHTRSSSSSRHGIGEQSSPGADDRFLELIRDEVRLQIEHQLTQSSSSASSQTSPTPASSQIITTAPTSVQSVSTTPASSQSVTVTTPGTTCTSGESHRCVWVCVCVSVRARVCCSWL